MAQIYNVDYLIFSGTDNSIGENEGNRDFQNRWEYELVKLLWRTLWQHLLKFQIIMTQPFHILIPPLTSTYTIVQEGKYKKVLTHCL